MADKRYCKDCQFLACEIVNDYYKASRKRDVCQIAIVAYDPVCGEVKTPSNPHEKNADFNCPDWTPVGGTRAARGPLIDEVSATSTPPPPPSPHQSALDYLNGVLNIFKKHGLL